MILFSYFYFTGVWAYLDNSIALSRLREPGLITNVYSIFSEASYFSYEKLGLGFGKYL
jgi:hypothetical protein